MDHFPTSLAVQSALQSKICMRSYRLFYVPRTEDLLMRHGPAVAGPLPSSSAEKTRARFEQYVERRKEELKPVLVQKEREKEEAEERKRVEAEEAAEREKVAEEERLKAVEGEAAARYAEEGESKPVAVGGELKEATVAASAPVDEDVKMSDA